MTAAARAMATKRGPRGRARTAGIGAALLLALLTACWGRAVVAVDGSGAAGGGSSAGSAAAGGSSGAGGVDDSCGADLESDPSHCGRCGHACQGGECVDGACQPIVLAADLGLPSAIAVDATSVYWRDLLPTAINKVPLGGGEVVPVATYIESDQEHLAVGASHAYFSGALGSQWYSVLRVPLGGGEVSEVAPSDGAILAVAIDQASVYWTESSYGGGVSLKKVALDGGGSPLTLAVGLKDARAIAVGPAGVYWVDWDYGRVWTVPLEGGTPALFAAGQNHPIDIAADETSVYWLNYGTTNAYGEGSPDGTVMRAPLAGGSVTTLASGQHEPRHLALDGSHVYWTLGEGQAAVMRVPLGGGEAELFAAAGNAPWDVAVDGVSVYWTATDQVSAGRVLKIAK